MGVFDFVRNAGAKVGIGKSTDEIDEEAREKEAAAAAAKASIQKINKARVAQQNSDKTAVKRAAAVEERRKNLQKSEGLENYVRMLGLEAEGIDIRYDDGVAYINGTCPSFKAKQQLILAVGNCEGVGSVDEDIEIVRVKQDAPDEEEATLVTVKSGDTLSAIARDHLGDAGRYPEIFEANKPMLKDPDLIFPGQVLRIPGA